MLTLAGRILNLEVDRRCEVSRALASEAERDEARAERDEAREEVDALEKIGAASRFEWAKLVHEETGKRLAAEARVLGLEEALKPFARYAEHIEPYVPDSLIRLESYDAKINVRDLRRAALALSLVHRGVGDDLG